MKGVVLLSGGMDSTVTLAYALRECESVQALVFNYGQRNEKEISAALAVATHYDVPTTLVDARFFRAWGASALTDQRIAVPTIHGPGKKIREALLKPATYVPARNTVFLSIAASAAEAWGYDRIYYGANYVDSSGYPDCTPRFVRNMQTVIQAGTYANIVLYSPLLDMTKAEIVLLGEELRVPWHLTWSCYQNEEVPCGVCDSCCLRAKGFDEAGVFDSLVAPLAVAYG